MQKSYLRGHEIEYQNNEWVYSDNKESTVKTHEERPCKHCCKHYTKDGHDACLGTLIGVMNACCGHGVVNEAYVQFLDGSAIHGEDATIVLEVLKKYNTK